MINIIPWKSDELSSQRDPFILLQENINHLFDHFFKTGFLETPLLSTGNIHLLTPAIDLVEDENGFKLEVELPGMTEKDVEITVSETHLMLKGQRKEIKEEKDKNYLRRERSYGLYQRSIPLPETANTEQAKATFEKGVLCVWVPKKAEAVKHFRRLEIKKAS